MASAGCSLPEICAWGEWRGMKVPGNHYVDEDTADHEHQLRAMVESEDEPMATGTDECVVVESAMPTIEG